MAEKQFKPKQHVVRGDACIECCLRIRRRVNVEIGALLSSLYEGINSARPGDSLAIAPLPLAAIVAAFARIVVLNAAEAAAAAGPTLVVGGGVAAGTLGPSLVGGVAILSGGLSLASIVGDRVALETLTLVVGAIQNYFDLSEKQLALARQHNRKLPGDCSDCVERRMLSSSARRQRQVAKILRRL